LALNEQAKDRIRMADGIPILLNILSERSNTLKEQTAWAIANLANNSATNADVLRIGGAIKKLVALLNYSDEIKFRVLWALYCLSLHEKNLNTFRDEMAIAPIAKLLTSTNKHFVELSSKIISQIAVIEENKKVIISQGFVDPLIALLNSHAVARINASAALTTLCTAEQQKDYVRKRIMETDGITLVSKMLTSSSENVTVHGIRLLRALSRSENIKFALQQTPAFVRIKELAEIKEGSPNYNLTVQQEAKIAYDMLK